MSHTVSRRNFLKGIGALGMLTVLSSCARTPQQAAAVGGGLPAISVWATYPTGTGTYNDLAALANMVSANGGTRVRLMTDNTGIGRLGPVINGTAQYGRVGDEYYYAFEGNDEYTSENWGPTPIRLVWTPPGNYGILTRRDSGIETVADIKGKRYPRLISSTSMNRKLEVALALGGLTTDDVEMVDIAYSEQAEAMKTGHLDVMYQNVVGGTIEELNSQYPIRWLDLSGGTPEQYKFWEELSPMSIPGEFQDGVGMKPGESCVNMRYSLPIIALEDRPKDEVKAILDLLRDNIDNHLTDTPDMDNFTPDSVMLVPMTVPFHEGSIEFFKEIGRWTPGLQRRQDALLEREKAMQKQWPIFWKENRDKDNARELWVEWKRENLPALPEVTDVETTT
ncbi:TAXI family TRAP transporter solute-binding subunit [Corynebacterium gallinarum]|uniref:TAXI family TRAP transporter solute-binding subunit n=1 Tax=Corynebacterium gallinarum TaxID=2762214 RepID=A0A8I0LF72_9CORY|nr:TAXI family TRAP transporter solute-binding subunit [Corynebacterium gallinarum]MBD8029314.1 TAXI family TRAP transporter solute-binding subunit [Corynebacterium gallinarum]